MIQKDRCRVRRQLMRVGVRTRGNLPLSLVFSFSQTPPKCIFSGISSISLYLLNPELKCHQIHCFPFNFCSGGLSNSRRMSGSNLEKRSLADELRSFDSGGFFDLGHPLLNRITESFIKAAGIGAIQAVSREAYFTALESATGDNGGSVRPEVATSKKHNRFPELRGENNQKSVEALVKNTGKESLQWGVAAGVYSGLTYGLKEARGVHDWKNSALAGAVTGAAVALTSDDFSHEQVVQCAITGAAISTAANLLTGIF